MVFPDKTYPEEEDALATASCIPSPVAHAVRIIVGDAKAGIPLVAVRGAPKGEPAEAAAGEKVESRGPLGGTDERGEERGGKEGKGRA